MVDPTGYVPADATAPSESFVNPPIFTDVHSGDIYPMLQSALRQMDETQGTAILQRVLERPEELFRRHQQKLWRITRLSRADEVPDALVSFLLTFVAFGEGSGLPWEVAQKLSTDNQRKLLRLAVPYWLKRGRRVALEASIRFITGVRPAIDSWFDVRSIVDELILGGEGGPTDPWMIWSTRVARDAAPNVGEDDDWAEHHVSLRVPGIVGDAERQQMVADLCEIARPFGERYEIAFVDFIDVMLDGWLPWWVSLGAVDPTWVVGHTSTDPVGDPWKLPGLSLANSIVHLDFHNSATWTTCHFNCFLKLPAGVLLSVVELRFGVVDLLNHWAFRLDLLNDSIDLFEVVAGGGVNKATLNPFVIDRPATYSFVVEARQIGANRNIRLTIDGTLRIDFTEAGVVPVGSVGVSQPNPVSIELQRPEVFQFPLTSVLLKP